MSKEVIGLDSLGNKVQENMMLLPIDGTDDRWYCVVQAYSGDYYIVSTEERPGKENSRLQSDIDFFPISDLGNYEVGFTGDGEPLFAKEGDTTERHMELFLTL